MAHLARFAASEAGLLRVLLRRVERWASAAQRSGDDPDAIRVAAESARLAAREVAGALVKAGTVDDAAYAGQKARSLARAGRSTRAVLAQLIGKGISPDLASDVLPGPDEELAAALAYARRRRIGPFRAAAPDAAASRQELGALARAGFPRAVAMRALGTDRAEAEAMIRQFRQG